MLRNDAPDYNELWDEYERNKQAELDKLPRCNECGEPIQGEHLFDFYGKILCEDCVETFCIKEFRKAVEDYIE